MSSLTRSPLLSAGVGGYRNRSIPVADECRIAQAFSRAGAAVVSGLRPAGRAWARCRYRCQSGLRRWRFHCRAAAGETMPMKYGRFTVFFMRSFWAVWSSVGAGWKSEVEVNNIMQVLTFVYIYIIIYIIIWLNYTVIYVYILCIYIYIYTYWLVDGWPESVEEQSLLLLVWRHYITRQYIKDVL